MKKLAKLFPLVFFLACFLVALIFAGDNSQFIPLRFLDIELLSLPFALWLVLCFAIGALLVLFLLLPVLSLHRGKIRRLERKLRGLPTNGNE
jgi:uncharacterized integral membrane protein